MAEYLSKRLIFFCSSPQRELGQIVLGHNYVTFDICTTDRTYQHKFLVKINQHCSVCRVDDRFSIFDFFFAFKNFTHCAYVFRSGKSLFFYLSLLLCMFGKLIVEAIFEHLPVGKWDDWWKEESFPAAQKSIFFAELSGIANLIIGF
jgi:hypothetical protein